MGVDLTLFLQGDDQILVAAGNSKARQLGVTPGANGVLNSTAQGDDAATGVICPGANGTFDSTPDPSDDDAERSVRAGLAMNTALVELNGERERRNLASIRHGIGIHFGPVIAGNIGTEDRLEYTVIGDTVNVASRIQDACKSLGEGLLISEAVKTRLPVDIRVRPLPEQEVRGRRASVQIYAIEGMRTKVVDI